MTPQSYCVCTRAFLRRNLYHSTYVRSTDVNQPPRLLAGEVIYILCLCRIQQRPTRLRFPQVLKLTIEGSSLHVYRDLGLFRTPSEAVSRGPRISILNLDIKIGPSEPWKYGFKKTNNVKRRLEKRMGLFSLCALLGQYPIARRSSRRKQSFHTDSLPTMLVSQSFEARCTGRSRDRRDQSQYLSHFNLDVGPVRIVRSMLPPRRILPQRFIIADGSTFVWSRPRNFGRDFITSVYGGICR